MLLLDRRIGSGELAPLFLQYGIQPHVGTLDFGDMSWEGNGPLGKCSVCVERKRIDDLIQSMESKRLTGHQLPGMADQYDYAYLIVEGIWRPGPQGELQVGRGSFEADRFGGRWVTYPRLQHRSIDNYLATLELHAGVIYRRTLSAQETVAVVVDLYRWWREKKWGEHSSHLGVYAPAVPRVGRGGRLQLARRDVSQAEKFALQVPGLDQKAQAAAERFGSGRAMANASILDWLQIKGIGKVTAKQAWEAWNAEL